MLPAAARLFLWSLLHVDAFPSSHILSEGSRARLGCRRQKTLEDVYSLENVSNPAGVGKGSLGPDRLQPRLRAHPEKVEMRSAQPDVNSVSVQAQRSTCISERPEKTSSSPAQRHGQGQVHNLGFRQQMKTCGSFYANSASSLAHLERVQLLTYLKESLLCEMEGNLGGERQDS